MADTHADVSSFAIMLESQIPIGTAAFVHFQE